jgi:magnesium-transporting ATPase (P-type)
MKSDLEKRFESILEEEEKPESEFYNKPFKVGVLFTIALFIVSNFISYFVAYNYYIRREKELLSKGISFGDAGGYSWGFPFELYRNFYTFPFDIGFTSEGIVLITFVVVMFSFIFGFLFRFVWSKISYRFVKVN